MNISLDNYYSTRKNVFERIQDASTATKVLMSFMMACFTGIMAQIIIPLPWTPVPITAQTFAVLCSGLFLGKKYGCLSQILYIVLGVAFIPWFGGMTGGLDVFLGSTFGFFIGFVIASYFIGLITEKYAKARNFTKMALVIGIANFALIYIPGLAGLALWFNLTQGTTIGIVELLMMGLVPFIVGDIVKILGAASVSKVFLPDDICKACPNLKDDLCENELQNARIVGMDWEVLKKLNPSNEYNAIELFEKIDDLFDTKESVSEICFNCMWHDKCLFYQKLSNNR